VYVCTVTVQCWHQMRIPTHPCTRMYLHILHTKAHTHKDTYSTPYTTTARRTKPGVEWEIYRNETNITFQRNPPPPTSSHRFQGFTSFFLIPSEKKFFGCLCNKFFTAPMTYSSDENLLPLRASFIGPDIRKSDC
jgi:hypothetical protein